MTAVLAHFGDVLAQWARCGPVKSRKPTTRGSDEGMRGRASFLAAVPAALALLPALAEADVRFLALAARASHDVGTVFVSGTESGWGGGIRARLSFGGGDVRWEPEVALDRVWSWRCDSRASDQPGRERERERGSWTGCPRHVSRVTSTFPSVPSLSPYARGWNWSYTFRNLSRLMWV